MADKIEILDARPQLLATPEVLKNARSKKDVKVLNYNDFSVSFLEDKPETPSVESLRRPDKICDSALDLVGKTPMVRLSRFAEKYGLKCELLAKCEFLSVGGSTKDRIGHQMVLEGERQGRVKHGDILVEASSGNTGVGMALAALVKGYKLLIALPEKMSQEKLNTLSVLGAEITRTPTEAAWNSIDSHIGLATQLAETLPNCHFLDQYQNAANPRAHYSTTAEEILYQCDGNIDMIVMTAGTGGTITGVAAKIKERLPTCEIVGVDPKGSILAQPKEMNDDKLGESYLVEGIGYDFIPSTLHRGLISKWTKSDDNEAFRLARELIRLEGLLVGGSSGAALAGVLKVAKNLKAGDRCVVVLPDSSRNYMTKFISDEWMVDKGFYTSTKPSSDFGAQCLSSLMPFPSLKTVTPEMSCRHGLELSTANYVPVTKDGAVVGLLSWSDVLSAVATGCGSKEDLVKKFMTKNVKLIPEDATLLSVSESLKLHPCVVVVDSQKKPKAVLTAYDILTLSRN